MRVAILSFALLAAGCGSDDSAKVAELESRIARLEALLASQRESIETSRLTVGKKGQPQICLHIDEGIARFEISGSTKPNQMAIGADDSGSFIRMNDSQRVRAILSAGEPSGIVLFDSAGNAQASLP